MPKMGGGGRLVFDAVPGSLPRGRFQIDGRQSLDLDLDI
jgi:hypothetical protein